jgi:hypothetical protein
MEDYLSPRKNSEERYIFEILDLDLSNWPPPFRLNRMSLIKKYRLLKKIMEKKRFFLEFAEKLPLVDAYRYLTETFIYDKEYEMNDGWRCIVTGCGGDCPSCFQKDYCDSVEDIWSKEEMEKELIRRCREVAT